MPPLSDGACPGLLAVNAAYRRDALDEVAASWRGGFYDNEVHDALAARGHLPQAAAGAVVESRLELPFPRALRHLFEGGRRYGAYRRASGPALMRVRRVLAAPLVPLVLQARILRRVGRCRPRELGRALRAQPQVAALLLAWGGGELVGGLVGDDRAARAH
jgi:hypothetical protein